VARPELRPFVVPPHDVKGQRDLALARMGVRSAVPKFPAEIGSARIAVADRPFARNSLQSQDLTSADTHDDSAPRGRGRNPSVSPRRTIRLSPREAARSAGEGWRATPDSPERASGRLSKLLSRSAGARSRASSPGEGAAAHDYKIKLVTNSGRARDLMNKTWFRSWPVPGPSRRSGLLPLRCLRTDG